MNHCPATLVETGDVGAQIQLADIQPSRLLEQSTDQRAAHSLTAVLRHDHQGSQPGMQMWPRRVVVVDQVDGTRGPVIDQRQQGKRNAAGVIGVA